MRRVSRWPRQQVMRREGPGHIQESLSQYPEHFQIYVHVMEARSLVWRFPLTSASYVLIVYGRKKLRTAVRKNRVEPIYRETFVFDTFKSICDLEESSIWLGVMETRCCSSPRLMGEGSIDLAWVWAQPNHKVNEKWIQLSLPSKTDSVGFIKVGVFIIHKGDINVINMQMHTKMVANNYEKIHRPASSSEQQKANYQFTIFAAFGLSGSDRRHGKLNTFVKVTFCGLVGKTGVKYRDNNPVYSEQISMVELFPNANQNVYFEVCVHENANIKVLGYTHLNLDWISHDGVHGFLPTFGPSLLHMYGALNNQVDTEGPYHRGALLVSMKTVVPFDKQKIKTISLEPTIPLKIDTHWRWDGFCIYCPLFEVSIIDVWVEGKCGVGITIGELFNHYGEDKDEGGEFKAMLSEIRKCLIWTTDTRTLASLKDSFSHSSPSEQQKIGASLVQVFLRVE